MVKVSFVVEGDVEKIFVDHLIKTKWFKNQNIEIVGPVINAKGGGNLCPHNMQQYVNQVDTFNPDKIVILTDFECDPCVTKTKERLGSCNKCVIILARKAIEAWFLADSTLLHKMTKGSCASYHNPETTVGMPFEEFKALLLEHTGRGCGSKVSLAKNVIRNGFSIDNAALHSNCDSAKYFVDKIKLL